LVSGRKNLTLQCNISETVTENFSITKSQLLPSAIRNLSFIIAA